MDRRGEAPIVFTLGSSAVFAAGDFYLDAAMLPNELTEWDIKVRTLLLTGGAHDNSDLMRDSSNILAIDYAPYSEIFPLAQIVVHQGGAGTTAQSLRAGVPQIIVPHAHDQPDHAARIRRLGVGCSISHEDFTRVLPGTVMQILQTPLISERAQELGARIRAENGPRAACEAIERLST
jgi:UDP:flavonoid glycosyltransferase YjiC (YdhE family)